MRHRVKKLRYKLFRDTGGYINVVDFDKVGDMKNAMKFTSKEAKAFKKFIKS